jgi:hypothetical protein
MQPMLFPAEEGETGSQPLFSGSNADIHLVH